MNDLLKKVPDIYKFALVVIAATVFVLTYHDKFVTIAQAAESKRVVDEQMLLMRVDSKEKEKRVLIREKAKAVKIKDVADAEIIEQDIQTLRDQIKKLCSQTDKCYQGGG